MSSAKLIHEALVYADDDGFTEALTPFLTDGVRNGDAVVAAVTGRNIGLLRRRLGADAGRVTFLDRDAWYVRPASTIAGWTDLLAAARVRGQRSVRIVGEVAFGARARHDTWIRYESAINEVFAAAPAWIICPYDARDLPDRVIAGARRTHPTVVAGHREPSGSYQLPGRLLHTVAEPMPRITRAPVLAVNLAGPLGPGWARRAVRALAHDLGWERPAIDNLLLVVTEVAVNAVLHGRGDRRLSVWTEPPAITCEVTDRGDGFADPLAGYRPPAHPERHGVGLWLAGQLSDQLAIDRRDGTTRVRFRISR